MSPKWDETRRRCICGHELGRHTWNRARCLDRDCGCVAFRGKVDPAFTDDEMARCGSCGHRRLEHRPDCVATTARHASDCPCEAFVEEWEALGVPVLVAPEGTTYEEMMAWPEMQAIRDAMETSLPDLRDRCCCGHEARDHRIGRGTCLLCQVGRPDDYCWFFRPEIGAGLDDEREPEDPFDRPPRPPATREEFAAMAVHDALDELRGFLGAYDRLNPALDRLRECLTTAINNLPDVSERIPQ